MNRLPIPDIGIISCMFSILFGMFINYVTD
jgi:hypothetical protein